MLYLKNFLDFLNSLECQIQLLFVMRQKKTRVYHMKMCRAGPPGREKIGRRGSRGVFAQTRRQGRQYYLLKLGLVEVSQMPATSGARVSRWSCDCARVVAEGDGRPGGGKEGQDSRKRIEQGGRGLTDGATSLSTFPTSSSLRRTRSDNQHQLIRKGDKTSSRKVADEKRTAPIEGENCQVYASPITVLAYLHHVNAFFWPKCFFSCRGIRSTSQIDRCTVSIRGRDKSTRSLCMSGKHVLLSRRTEQFVMSSVLHALMPNGPTAT